MNTEYSKPKIEKPKPLKVRAATAATRLINLRSALGEIIGEEGNPTRIKQALTEAINVLQVVAETTRTP